MSEPRPQSPPPPAKPTNVPPPGSVPKLPQTIFNLGEARPARWPLVLPARPAVSSAPLRSPETLDEFKSGIVAASRHLRRKRAPGQATLSHHLRASAASRSRGRRPTPDPIRRPKHDLSRIGDIASRRPVSGYRPARTTDPKRRARQPVASLQRSPQTRCTRMLLLCAYCAIRWPLRRADGH